MSLRERWIDRSFMNRYFRPLFRIVKEPWQIYPIGVLFGLGFDTATQITLIAISVGIGVSSSVPRLDDPCVTIHVHVWHGIG